MTTGEAIARKEAIARIKDHKIVHKMDEPRAVYISEALDLAIKALEQQPSEDCISRQAVNVLVDELARAISDERCCISRGRSTATIMRDILHLPSVTPQQKVGQWVKHDTGHSIYYDCSLCGCAAPCTETADKILWKMANYCPDCGAKMEVEENDE